MKKILFLVLILVANVSFGQVQKLKKKKIIKAEKTTTVDELYNNSAIIGEHVVRHEGEIKPSGDDISVEREYNENNKDQIFASAGLEEKPDFPGGLQAFFKFVGDNYKMPQEPGLRGKVFVQFIIEKDGSLTDIKVVRDIGFGTGNEAIRVLKLCPKWYAGKLNGNLVRCNYMLPISIDGGAEK